MRILVAPLNWGLGHASRCIPLIERLLAEGNEVVLGGDGESLTLLKKHFPNLAVLPFAPLNLRYSKGKSQVWAMVRALPQIIRSAKLDHTMLAEYLLYEQLDEVISDNRFGLYLSLRSKELSLSSGHTVKQSVKTVYISHQLIVPMPRFWTWLEPIVERWHKILIHHFDECWIPDEAVSKEGRLGLAGRLSHPVVLPANAKYIGILSRFSGKTFLPDKSYKHVVVLSGLEPQRTLFEQAVCRCYENSDESVLIVRGKMQDPPTVIRHGKLTIVPWLDDAHLGAYLCGAEHIICRSGYSSVMDMYALGVIEKVEWQPTPGQPEQEYLAKYLAER